MSRWIGGGRRLHYTGIAILLALALGQPPDTARAAPTLTIAPAIAPCGGRVTIAGEGFAPASRVGLVARATAPPSGQGVEFAALTVGVDGTFRAEVAVATMIPQCRAATPPQEGTIITIYASTPPLVDKTGAAPEVTLATATLTLGPTTPGLPNTGGGMRARTIATDPLSLWMILGGVSLLLVERCAMCYSRRRARCW